MNWQLVILLQTVLVGAGMISLRVLARTKEARGASFAISASMYVVLYASMLLLLPWLGSVHAEVVRQYWWRFVGGGVAFALTNVCTYKTLVYFDAAVAAIAGTVNAIFAVIGASLFLDERLSWLQLGGGVVLLAAIGYGVLATRTVGKKSVSRSTLLGVTFALLAGLTYGIAQVNEKSLLLHMNMATYVVFGVGGQCVMTVLLALVVQRKQFLLLRKLGFTGWVSLSGLLRGLGGACFIFSEIKSDNVGLLAVITNFRLIVVLFLAVWLLKEREHIAKKLSAAMASIAGLAILFWK